MDKSFWEHLEELRRRIIYSLISIFLFSILGYFLSGYVIDHFGRIVQGIYFFSPAEGFIARLKVALYIGFFLGIPFTILQLYIFVAPGLLPHERRVAKLLLGLSLPFFFSGVIFSVYVVIPIGLKFLLRFSTDTMLPMINISKLISFVFWTSIGIGLVFQLPLVVYVLTKLGIIDYHTLTSKRRIAYVVIFIVIAFITPSVDAFSLLLISLPIVLLYEISVLISFFLKKKDG